MEGLGAAGFD